MLQVESAINQMLATQLPAGTSFEVRRMDPTVFPVLGYSLTSDTHSLVELRDLALYQIRPVLSTVHRRGPRRRCRAGATASTRCSSTRPSWTAFGLSLDDVATPLSAANVITAVGRLEDHDKLYLVVSDTQFADFDQIGQTVLRSGENGLVRLEDVATVQHAAPRRSGRA